MWTAKYGDRPTLIGDGRIYYFNKGGKVVFGEAEIHPCFGARGAQRPINPKAALARSTTHRAREAAGGLKHAQALDKEAASLLAEAKSANCDGLVVIEVSPGITSRPRRQG